MKIGIQRFRGSRFLIVWMVAMALGSAHALATIHVVLFGGTLGEAYSPSSFSAVVGDTVEWQGDFTVHPLSSTTIPDGASSWHNSVGTVFDYVIMVAGTYDYQCDVHQPIMVGSFTAVVTGVDGSVAGETPTSFRLEQNYPNPFNPTTVVRYQLLAPSVVRLEVFDILGRRVALLVDRQEVAGDYQVPFDGSGLASGTYEYRLTARSGDAGRAGGFVQTKKMLLAR